MTVISVLLWPALDARFSFVSQTLDDWLLLAFCRTVVSVLLSAAAGLQPTGSDQKLIIAFLDTIEAAEHSIRPGPHSNAKT